MALTSLRLTGFKCFADSGDVRVAPLTVVVGRNSSGKSSLIQSLLLLKQTIESPAYGNTINFKGPYYEAGGYKEVVHHHNTAQSMTIEFGFRFLPITPADAYLHLLKGSPSDDPSCEIGVVRLKISPIESYSAQIKEIEIHVEGGPDFSLDYVQPPDKTPGKWLIKSPQTPRFVGVSGLSPFGSSMFPTIWAERQVQNQESHVPESGDAFVGNLFLGNLDVILRNIRLMGPFRDRPKRRYEFSGGDFSDLGLAGENTIDALIADTKNNKNTHSAIVKWLKEAKLATGFSLVPSTDPGSYQVQFKIGPTEANFADVGFGLSQVLPVLVQGLRTPKHAMFICQQPELHLHPDGAVALADFFVSLVNQDKQVFVETHSEHLLLGIRRILAEEKNKEKPLITKDQVSLLYVDDSKPGESTVRPLELDEDMNVVNWPEGFMDQATQELLKIWGAAQGEDDSE
jgi:predicted ATPase